MSYFDRLEKLLSKLPANEREEALQYYKEYAEDAGVFSDSDLEALFGSPKTLAAQACADVAVKTLEEKKSGSAKKAFGIGLLALFSLPITLPLAITIVALILTFIIVIFSLVISGGGVAIGFIGAALISFRMAWDYLMMQEFLSAGAVFGAGLMLISGAGFTFWLMGKIAKLSVKGIVCMISKIARRKKDEKEF